MNNNNTNVTRKCEKCSQNVKLYIVCFKCDLTYHPNCWRKLPGSYLNENGHAFCCWKNDDSAEDSEETPNNENKYEPNNEQKLFQEDTDLKHNTCVYEQEESCENDKCESSLNQHILVKHRMELKEYNCKYCNYSTHMKTLLVVHIRKHTNDRPFKCTYKNCKCTPGQEKSCKCDTCGYAATTKGALNQHILVKHSRKSKRFNCNDCNYSTHMKSLLLAHTHKHTNDRPFKCLYKNCKCTPGQEEFCNCDMCGYAATTKGTLNQHILVKHSAEPKNYKCKDCNYASHMKRLLLVHIRKHTNERPFKCIYKNCKCTSGQKKSCKCDTCGYSTTTKGTLNQHILLKHSTESKKYNCNDCNYATRTKRLLVQHVCKHTKDESF